MAFLFRPYALLKQVPPLLCKDFLQCRAYGLQARRCRRTLQSKRLSPFLQSFRLQTTQIHRLQSSPVGQLGERIVADAVAAAPQKRAWPKTSRPVVAFWLLGSAASVFGIVVFGGLTRLTESGLSITEWKPVTGSLPPFRKADWESEFSKYKSSPEFALLNARMTLEEFKRIYWMEWTHRLWGRVIGVTFLLPTVYFIARRRVPTHMAWKLSGICGLIGFQGVIGWWMVASGLKDDLFAPGSHPRVSQYRLAAHLGTAFLVYCSMLWTGLSILQERAALKNPTSARTLVEALRHPRLRLFQRSVWVLAALVFTTAMSGALVAGLDAGLIYNEFPWMGLGLTPPKAELFDQAYSRAPGGSDLIWRNALENPSLVQLDHRILATTTFTAVCALFAYPRLTRSVRVLLPRPVIMGLTGVFHVAWLQVALGISTLIYMVPTWLAAAHQAGALALLTATVVLARRSRVSPRTIQMLRRAAEDATWSSTKRSGPATVKPGVGIAANTVEQRVR